MVSDTIPSMLQQYLPYLIAAFAVFVVLLGIALNVVFALWRAYSKKLKAQSAALWAAGAYGLWTGAEDSGSWPVERAQRSLNQWYGAEDADDLDGVLADLQSGATGNLSWDLCRCVDLLRIGVAARYLDDEQCWERTAAIAKVLRARYGSWEELASDFEAGMQAWQHQRGVTDPEQRGRVQRNLPVLRATIWPRVSYSVSF